LILTSHGSQAGVAVKAGRLTQLLTPLNLADMLALTGVRQKVVVISACYSGVFIPPLANANVLVITDADHPSYRIRGAGPGFVETGRFLFAVATTKFPQRLLHIHCRFI
jgi:hypothetical protein